MGYIETAWQNDYVPPKLLEDGEYQLNVRKAIFCDTKAGDRKQVKIIFACVSDPTAAPIFEYLGFPKNVSKEEELADEKIFFFNNQARKRMQEFTSAFGVSQGFNFDDVTGEVHEWIGAVGWATVVTQLGNEQFPDPSNKVSSFTRTSV